MGVDLPDGWWMVPGGPRVVSGSMEDFGGPGVGIFTWAGGAAVHHVVLISDNQLIAMMWDFFDTQDGPVEGFQYTMVSDSNRTLLRHFEAQYGPVADLLPALEPDAWADELVLET